MARTSATAGARRRQVRDGHQERHGGTGSPRCPAARDMTWPCRATAREHAPRVDVVARHGERQAGPAGRRPSAARRTRRRWLRPAATARLGHSGSAAAHRAARPPPAPTRCGGDGRPQLEGARASSGARAVGASAARRRRTLAVPAAQAVSAAPASAAGAASTSGRQPGGPLVRRRRDGGGRARHRRAAATASRRRRRRPAPTATREVPGPPIDVVDGQGAATAACAATLLRRTVAGTPRRGPAECRKVDRRRRPRRPARCSAAASRATSRPSATRAPGRQRRSPLHTTATSSTERAAGSSSRTRRVKDAARADDSGERDVRAAAAAARRGPRRSSAIASGLPPVSSCTRASHSSVTGVEDRPSTRLRPRPGRARRGRAGRGPRPGRRASPARPRRTSPPGRRRAAARRRPAHWPTGGRAGARRPAATATGASSAYRQSRLSVAAPIANRSPARPLRPSRGPPTAREPGVAAIVSSRPSAGRSTASRPANGTSRSGSVPVARRTRNPSRRLSVQRSSDVLPTPGSPVTASTPLAPILAPETSRSMVRCSCSRPISTRRV